MSRYMLLLALALALAASCNLEPRKPADEEIAALQKTHDDSLKVIVDSMMKVNVYVPPLYDKSMFDSVAVKEYSRLANVTGGEFEVLVNSRLLTNEIVRIIREHGAGNADLLLMVDKTGSMGDDIDVVRHGLGKVLAELETYQGMHLGILMYGDKNADGDDWFSFKDFGTDYKGARSFVNAIEVTGGGDWPESVYDAFFKVDEQNFWRSDTRKMVVLIGDACSLKKPLADHDLDDVIKKATADKITMNFYPIIITPSFDNGAEFAATKTYKDNDSLITSLYPNPSNGNITVEFAQDDDYTINVYDYQGRPVYSETFTGSHWNKDLSSLHTGTFVFSAIGKSMAYERRKFVIL